MSSGGGQQGDDKNSMQILWIITGVFLVAGGIWFGFSEQLKVLFIAIKKYELYLAYYALKYLPFDALFNDVEVSLILAKSATKSNLSLDSANLLATKSGQYLSPLYILILLYFVNKGYFKNVKMRYKKRYSMKTLVAQEKQIWPQIKAVSGIDLVAEDLDTGPWAMGFSPVQFCKANNLITIEVEKPSAAHALKGPKFNMILDKDRATKVFSLQLGNLWRGVKHLPPHRRAVFAVLAARGCRDSDASKDLSFKINSSIKEGKIGEVDFSGVDELLNKHANDPRIKKICTAHAYEYCVFIALFLFAREDGVLASADFLWVKPIDRPFWFVLNNVGRKTAVSEAAGSYAHFLAEKSLRRPLSVPFVEEAVKALQLALNDVLYTPSEAEQTELLQKAGYDK
jgi:intracellular multiplication protein IcmP